MSVLTCSLCGATDPRRWAWVQSTRINDVGVGVTEASVEVETDGVVEYESVIDEHLRYLDGGEVDRQGRTIVSISFLMRRS